MSDLNYWTDLMARWGVGVGWIEGSEQSKWQDGQPLCTAVHQPARLRYAGISVEEGDTTGAAPLSMSTSVASKEA
jgi:hypothetical protein